MKIKGHTEIQLRDAKTGRLVQCTHDDNMITHALDEFLKNHGMLNPNAFTDANINADVVNTLLGGVHLYASPQTEDANNTFPSAANTLTANAASGYAEVAGGTTGSYNAAESGWMNTTMFRHVFDWTTSQGNGVISSVSLTSKPSGILGRGLDKLELASTGNKWDGSTNIYTYDRSKAYANVPESNMRMLCLKGNELYWWRYVYDTTEQTGTLTIRKHHVCNTELDFKDANIIPAFDDMELVAKFEGSELFSELNLNEQPMFGFDETHAFFEFSTREEYTITNADTHATRTAYGRYYRILVLSLDDFSIEDKFSFNQTDLGFGTTEPVNNIPDTDPQRRDRPAMITNAPNSMQVWGDDNGGICFAMQNYQLHKTDVVGGYVDEYVIMRIDLTTHQLSIAEDMPNPPHVVNFSTSHEPYFIKNGLVYGRRWLYDGHMHRYGDGNVADMRNIAPVIGSPLMIGINGPGNGYIIVRYVHPYIASINNLQTPVTKDATQVMKLIYTLTFTD